ncbi:c-type cytochrome [Hymenobacter rigui]|uniref:Cytochrome c n=1 Tax=Hymenobacter rigui TaxID=334424 RepID=A0A428KWB1_9BACT|nr:cytochrome c [Hymenobacter rigui]RSK51005.1 cytochrome c [Hymenobacter rigui]
MPSPLLLRLHLLVVLAFLLFYALKAGLLLTGRLELLRSLRARTRVADSVLGLLILLSGGVMLWQYPAPTPAWLWTKLALVLVLLPGAIAAMRRQSKIGVALSFAGFLYVYGLAETGSLTLRPSTAATQGPAAPTPGRAEADATPDAAAPVDSTAISAASLAGIDSAQTAEIAASGATSEATPALAAGKVLYTRNCAVCHGTDGKLGLNGARDLTQSNLNETGRIYQVTHGSISKKMPAFQGKLTDEQIQQVVAYSLTLQ